MSLHAAATDVVVAATRRGVTLATAESLTAGLVAATVAQVPGASAVLRGGLIVYATELKHTLAGVDADLLAEHGPIHPEVARQLAAGARTRCGADLGVGLTGVAGPDPQDGHAVGEVYIALAHSAGVDLAELTLSGCRQEIRDAACLHALELLQQHLAELSPPAL